MDVGCRLTCISFLRQGSGLSTGSYGLPGTWARGAAGTEPGAWALVVTSMSPRGEKQGGLRSRALQGPQAQEEPSEGRPAARLLCAGPWFADLFS